MDKDWRGAVPQHGDIERLRELLDSGADINAKDRHGQTGLMIAAGHGQVDVVRLLIERGALLDHTAKYGLSAIMLAVVNGHVEIVRLLVQAGADLALRATGAPGFHGKTALDPAHTRGDSAMVEVLRGGVSQLSRTSPATLKVETDVRRLTSPVFGSGLTAAVALFVVWYDFCRVHQTLRITAAMEAGLADRVWSIEEIVGLLA